jgi:hypothetical protein
VNRLAGRPFALLGVHGLDHPPEKLKEVMAEEQLNWRSLAEGRPIAALWSGHSTPGYYLIDHLGVIRHKWMGYPGAAAIDTAIDALVEEAEGAAE